MWLTFKSIVVSIVVIQAICVCTIFGQTYYDGSACVFRGNQGICRVITECPSILADVTARRIGYGDMVSCGFKGKNPIICCPDNVVDRVDTSTSTTTEEIFTFDKQPPKTTPTTIVTSNNLTIPSTLPYIDLTKLLKGRDESASNNRIEESGRGLKDDVEWFQPGNIKDYVDIIKVDPLNLNNQLFKGDTNSLESDERTTKPTFNPDDPFSIYSFREPEQTIRRTTMRTTTVRTIREAPRGFTSQNPSSDYWAWNDGRRNSKPYYPVYFPYSFPRFLIRNRELAKEQDFKS